MKSKLQIDLPQLFVEVLNVCIKGMKNICKKDKFDFNFWTFVVCCRYRFTYQKKEEL